MNYTDSKTMEIIVAQKAGFCFGVKRALDITFSLSDKTNEGVYTLGPLIHNPQVIEKIRQSGINTVDDLSSQPIKTLIIRTHGVPPKIYDEISRKGYNLVDATCPFVKKAQQYAETLKKEGYQIIIVGDQYHPEVQGLIGFAGDDVVVANDENSLPPLRKRVGIIVQTTQRIETFERIAVRAISSAREVKVYNTICDYTAQRIRETRTLASNVDLVIVVGGKNSSNTTQLATFSKELCNNVYHIETDDELQDEWFRGIQKVGITGGASTPQWIIRDVENKIREISLRR
jgi:4-hydroxy-3-methylbut-2-enyl diphosphate reductase